MNRVVYINCKTQYGTETVDTIQRNEFNSYKDFQAEINTVLSEWRKSGFNVYTSQRGCKS